MKRNALTKRQGYKVTEHLRKNWRAVERDRPSQEECAAAATKKLGFTVTKANLANSLGCLGKKWPKAVGKPGKAELTNIALAAQVALLEKRVDALEEKSK